LVDDVGALGGEEDDDGVDQADEGEGADVAEEVVLVLVFAQKRAEGQTGDYGGA